MNQTTDSIVDTDTSILDVLTAFPAWYQKQYLPDPLTVRASRDHQYDGAWVIDVLLHNPNGEPLQDLADWAQSVGVNVSVEPPHPSDATTYLRCHALARMNDATLVEVNCYQSIQQVEFCRRLLDYPPANPPEVA
jgi:hypothetical protein